MQRAIFGKRKGFHLHLRILPRVHKTDILVRQHGFDFEHIVFRHDHHQRLGRGHHAANSRDRQLLHRSGDGCGQTHQPAALLRLDQFLFERCGFLRCQVELIQQLATCLRCERGLLPLRLHQRRASFCYLGTASRQVLFLFDACLFAL